MTDRRPGARCDHPCAGLCRPDGLAEAHRAHRARLVAKARAVLGDPESAEDAVQDAFLRAWAACSAFDPDAGPTLLAWLSTITRNVVVDQVRARVARPQLPRTELGQAGEPPSGTSTASPTDTALQRMLLLDALATVSAEHRGVVLRTVLHDRSYRDVADELQVPVGYRAQPDLLRPARAAQVPRSR